MLKILEINSHSNWLIRMYYGSGTVAQSASQWHHTLGGLQPLRTKKARMKEIQASSTSKHKCTPVNAEKINSVKSQKYILYARCYRNKKAEGKLLWGQLNPWVSMHLWWMKYARLQLTAVTDKHVQFTTYHQLVKATENQLMPSVAVDLRMVLHYV